MPTIDFRNAVKVYQGGVEVKEVWHDGVKVWAKLNPILVKADISGTGEQGTEHTATYEADGTPAPTMSFQWYLNEVAIAGATLATYTPPVVMVGNLQVRVQAANIHGFSWIMTTPKQLALSVSGGTLVASTDDYDYRLFTSSGNLVVKGTVMAEVLAVAGGGAGGPDGGSGDPIAGGGGAGGAVIDPFVVLSGSSSPIAVTVGAGGQKPVAITGNAGANGADTTIGSIVAKGGGGGGKNYTGTGGPKAGQAGGSGGGGGGVGASLPFTGGSGQSVVGQGYSGGNGIATATATFRRGGGGGGFMGAGGASATNANGNGAAGMPFASVFAEDFGLVTAALGLTGTKLGFSGGGGGGTGQVSSGGGGLGGAYGGGTGGNGTPTMSTDATSYGGGGGGSGDGGDYGGNGYAGAVLVAVPKKGLTTKLTVWFSDDVYRDDDGCPAACVSFAFGKAVHDANPNVRLKGFIFGDCKVGAQWFILNPDSAHTSLPAGYNDGDTRYPTIASNKVAGGNRWFFDTHFIPAVTAAMPSLAIHKVYHEGATPAVHVWNFSPTLPAHISAASLAVANSIVAAIQNSQDEIVVYSAGGGANVAAEAIAYLLNTTSYTKSQLLAHFAVIQHGRNNWTFGYDARGGIKAQDLTREFTIAITNQNDPVYDNGWSGPDLTNAFRTFQTSSVSGTFINAAFNTAIKTAIGVTAASGVPANSTFSTTLDASDSGSHAFALSPGRVKAAMSKRMVGTETLQQGTANQHLIYDPVALTSRTRVLWHGFRNNAIARKFCGGV